MKSKEAYKVPDQYFIYLKNDSKIFIGLILLHMKTGANG